MPLYVHEVDARVVPEGGGAGGAGGLSAEDFGRIVDAVVREIERRRQHADALGRDARITGENMPPSVGL
jgi:hypothetical protein